MLGAKVAGRKSAGKKWKGDDGAEVWGGFGRICEGEEDETGVAVYANLSHGKTVA
ncbi:hypothetical protein FH972_000060 [Carpinus fangiana]|uniref:Uncharacterized protein n=1 Tax=Carpinus fangiana TaxID=176857 RepID=A0A5N6QAH4_9ROSI|nr:hypothetical protein FH972_000060 [Carpinus fangiana]